MVAIVSLAASTNLAGLKIKTVLANYEEQKDHFQCFIDSRKFANEVRIGIGSCY